MTLSIASVCCRYAAGPSLGPWTLRVSKGDRIGLAGTSGAGKTTLLDLVAGLHPPGLKMESGGIERAGRIGYVSQEPANSLSPFLTALDQVTAFCGDPRLAAAELRRLGLDSERLQRSYPCQLSGGERQRVQVAQALAMRPDFILADEPTANLDHETAGAVLRALSECGAGLLVSSHRTEVFEQLGCEKIFQLGSVEEAGEWPALGVPGETVADLVGLTHAYSRRDFWLRERPTGFALRDLPFHIREREVVALQGPSGSGKSTLARCIAAALGRKAQIVPQEPSRTLNPRQRLLDAFHEANAEADATVAMEAAGLNPAWLARRTSELSEGQRARVAIARALTALPNGGLLILDESLAGLDGSTESAVVRAIAEQQNRTGVACLIVAHHQRFWSHRELTMRDGRFMQ
jgi:peptide/nickel transport system ATP-binding protein